MNKYNVEVTLSFVTVYCTSSSKTYIFRREEWEAATSLVNRFSDNKEKFYIIGFLHKFFHIELYDSKILYDAAKEYDQ